MRLKSGNTLDDDVGGKKKAATVSKVCTTGNTVES